MVNMFLLSLWPKILLAIVYELRAYTTANAHNSRSLLKRESFHY